MRPSTIASSPRNSRDSRSNQKGTDGPTTHRRSRKHLRKRGPFRAGIDPSRRTDKVGSEALSRLLTETRTILQEAIEAKGTTLRDYRTGTGDTGSFQGVLQAYGRGGLPCIVCGATLATTHAIDGRATTFCYRCQA